MNTPGQKYILAVDEGTTGTTSLVIDKAGRVVSKVYQPVSMFYPQPGWVEQDAIELYQKAINGAKETILKAGITASHIKGIGISNQRETAVVWDRRTGIPVMNAIVWQCRRTAPMCEELKKKGLSKSIQEKTGLVIDAYFSATKLRWILDHIKDGQHRAEQGELLFGTIDSWLVWNLTGGINHITDYSNAARTMLFNIHTGEWDKEILSIFNIPEAVLPRVMPTSQIYTMTAAGIFEKIQIPIAAIAGDQQAALFGQTCFAPGTAKTTYGTGAFILLNTGNTPVDSKNGLLTTVAWGVNNRIIYALEGSVFVAGAAIQWLRDGLKIIGNSAESETLANSVPDNGGVYVVPAFTGLGTPYWDMYARGIIIGLTRGTTGGHIARATLEAIAYQVRDVITVMEKEAKLKIKTLRADGGGTANALLMQFQADILGIPVQTAAVPDITAMGTGYLAGLAVGFWHNMDDLIHNNLIGRTFEPQMTGEKRELLYRNWQRAVTRSLNWETDHEPEL